MTALRTSSDVDVVVPRIRIGPLSIALARRSVVVCVVLFVALVLACTASLVFGEIQVGLPRVLVTVVGEGQPVEELIVGDIRLPRVLLGVLVGAALAMSGALFQTITRNPLGSPDVIGFETGAATGGLVSLLFVRSTAATASVGAVVGGVVTAAAVYLLALRHRVDAMRLVLIGIGIAALLTSVNSMLIVSADVYDAQSVAVWLVGSLAGANWNQVGVLGALVAVLAVLALLITRGLRISELSDDTSEALGLDLGRARLAAIAVGVLLSSTAVAAAGPVVFIALSAPQVARRLTRAAGPNLIASALTGAVFLVVSDHAARELFQPRQIAVGVMTGVVGGLYLAWLLTREWRKGRA